MTSVFFTIQGNSYKIKKSGVISTVSKVYVFTSCMTPIKVEVSFVFNDLRWNSVVRSVDIGGILEHHCLNCLVLMCVNFVKLIE